MAKSGFIKTIQKNSPFKNLSTAFITLALLFIVSIILYFVFNKYTIEGFDKKIQKVTLITSRTRGVKPIAFIVHNDWNKIKTKYNNNFSFYTIDKQQAPNYFQQPRMILAESNYPMVVFSSQGSDGRNDYISDIKRYQLTYEKVDSVLHSALNARNANPAGNFIPSNTWMDISHNKNNK